MTETTETLKKRVDDFALLALPGQPQMMHMGTSYLVGDLWREIERLRARVAELEAKLELARMP